MQTFLPFRDYDKCAKSLDRQRLGKQRVENMQILGALLQIKVVTTGRGRTLEVSSTGWINHPITKMWAGYEAHLVKYQQAICEEWTARGYQDTCWRKTTFMTRRMGIDRHRRPIPPPFLGDREFHRAYRRILITKDAQHYLQAFRISSQQGVRDAMGADLTVIARYGLKDQAEWQAFLEQRRNLAAEIIRVGGSK